jgi:RNA polymerase sigma-70 factor (ECF subfamily)
MPPRPKEIVAVQEASMSAEVTSVKDRSDDVLARRAGLGDRSSFAEIFERHGAALYRYAVRMLNGDHQSAEDAVQETMTKAWLKLDRFRGDSSLRTWLFRLVANECIDSLRRRRPIAVGDDLISVLSREAAPGPHDVASVLELQEALDKALLELPWRQRAAWMLREVEDLSYAEIAEVLDTSLAVVRGQLHRARATLAIRMAQWR